MTPDGMKQSVETALAAFNEYKGLVDSIKTKQTTIEGKLDAFDAAKLDKLADDMATAIEQSQKAAAAAKALEEKNKLIEAALARPGAAATAERKEDAKAAGKKLFNAFARSNNPMPIDFADWLKLDAKAAEEFKALSTGVDPDGGFLTTPEFGGIVQTFVYESSPIRTLASVMTVGSNALELVLDNGQTSSGWVGESESRTETNTPVLNKLTITAKEVYAEPRATQQMLDDGIVDVEAWLAAKVGEELGRKEATAFVSGNGVAQPRGLLSYASGTDVAQQQIERVVSGNASNLTYDGLIDLTGALKEPYQANAVFLCRRATLTNLMKLKDGQGQPIFNMTYDRTAGVQRAILGQPLYFAADVPAVGAGNLALIYGDLRRAYQIVDRTGLRVLRDPYTTKPFVKFYTTKRVGGEVVNYEAVKIQTISA